MQGSEQTDGGNKETINRWGQCCLVPTKRIRFIYFGGFISSSWNKPSKERHTQIAASPYLSQAGDCGNWKARGDIINYNVDKTHVDGSFFFFFPVCCQPSLQSQQSLQ